MDRLKALLLLLLSLLMFAMAWAHSQLGWDEMRNGLQEANVTADIFGALQMGWYFGSFTFVAFGLLLLHQSMALFSREHVSGIPVAVVASVLLAFGVLGVVSRGWGMHYAGFLIIGFVIAMVEVIPAKATRAKDLATAGQASRRSPESE